MTSESMVFFDCDLDADAAVVTVHWPPAKQCSGRLRVRVSCSAGLTAARSVSASSQIRPMQVLGQSPRRSRLVRSDALGVLRAWP